MLFFLRKQNELRGIYISQLDELIEMKNKLKLSYGKLAEILNYDKDNLSKIFNKKRIVTTEKLKQFKIKLQYYEFSQNDKLQNEIIFDYVKIKFKNYSANFIIKNLIKSSESDYSVVVDRYIDGYEKAWLYFGENCFQILFNDTLDTPNVTLILSGEGCRILENSQNWTTYSDWLKFWNSAYGFEGNFLRVDVAYNDCVGVLDIISMIQDIDSGNYISRFRTFEKQYSQKDGLQAATLYCGGARSDLRFCVYEKAKEQFFKGKTQNLADCDIINRFEVRYKRSEAEWLIAAILKGYSVVNLFYSTVLSYLELQKNNSFNEFILAETVPIDFKIKPKEFDFKQAKYQLKKQWGAFLRAVRDNSYEDYLDILDCKPKKKVELYFQKKL